ncbi:hypothetical protein GNY06_09155 [Elizabethkingia argentiflava]|uniref:Beta-carotene 15,15'-monooxygenase n=1 Tax=Elizabethkingia argenteiflava TaxID=2681556 RepID=A0A845PTH2_9FLAO|nr:hypothetical protein [Elizabethkingia argenteiflava]NAW51539.1 hypothetical protein [Elizabethkingia argenteiflava]
MPKFHEFESFLVKPQRDSGSIISHAFENYKYIIGYVLVVNLFITLVFYVLFFITGSWTKVMSFNESSGDSYEFFQEIYASQSLVLWQVCSILFIALASPFIGGIIYLMHKKNSGQELDLSDLFIGYKKNTLNIMLFSLVYTLVAVVTSNMCLVPAIFIMPFLFLGYPILIFEEKGVIEAIKESFAIVKANYLNFLILNFVAIVISLTGLFFCCIGIVVTALFYYATMYSAYLSYRVEEVDHFKK